MFEMFERVELNVFIFRLLLLTDSMHNCFFIYIILFYFLNPFITIDCTGSMFGDGCLSQCGQCAVNLQCHHINGTCLNGCKPGYNLQFCNECK